MQYIHHSDYKGLPVENKNRNRLYIKWEKAFGEVYCSKADLTLINVPLSLFDSTAEIKVANVIRSFKSKLKEFTVETKRYLPYQTSGNECTIPLIDTELLNYLSANSWSKSKNGIDLQLMEAPAKLACTFNGYSTILNFDWILSRTPFLLIRPQLLSLEDGDSFEHTIYFD